ncbi:MAG: hypothetical protein A2836_00745 [Candidatus Taylorbacteria bacterium RIFCSPHIGHO2_01_FULL_45_63]|uniref:Uncharacterized protein n=1 Tax=Candidatus Taylorbacteria bacterium RIFCSPHIGHO2_02_FULL_45_35 TaxID=1802311 RepID=A0A1G2MTH0_9BACT|nr:MAG: hypothetical protein A2836_00745 [Candidatus Taylorbacteria bacterium RIFCSPHIGHO2_01_FULL_45_63]OHA27146.1 MAG: hypothetical protein A3D56_03445 [Candidatus Taylorbacteria bacterium RIFCSPHIGHO2_02_FULL_45_35]OHA33846.1 MAG: hypothetical protein A3A22_01420 [Candidatus Taylorbacteria bacterium RIFCSPLOWO2_01_FULL_45_34b]
MLTDSDIKKLLSVLTTKKDFEEVKKEIFSLRETVQNLTTSIDGLAKAVDNFRIEYSAITTQIERHERWIKQIAEKAGVRLNM